jgi:Ni,Fe-hydrogenase III component G
MDAQTNMKEFQVGHPFYVSLPDYMIKTSGLNSASAIQFKSEVKDVYGFIIEDNKEEMALVDIVYTSIGEFYEDFIKDFLLDEKKRQITKPVYSKNGEINFAEADATYFDKEADTEIYYLVGIVETKTSFYKVLSWSTVANKDKFKTDFQKIVYSLKD